MESKIFNISKKSSTNRKTKFSLLIDQQSKKHKLKLSTSLNINNSSRLSWHPERQTVKLIFI